LLLLLPLLLHLLLYLLLIASINFFPFASP
jgi:hypothetical protein